MNFRVKETGFVYEWQYRGALVNNFAEGEHVPYDLRTGKDIIGKNTELEGLYKPMIDILAGEHKMSNDEYSEYESYLTAHYEYLRFKELEQILKTSAPEEYAKLELKLYSSTPVALDTIVEVDKLMLRIKDNQCLDFYYRIYHFLIVPSNYFPYNQLLIKIFYILH